MSGLKESSWLHFQNKLKFRVADIGSKLGASVRVGMTAMNELAMQTDYDPSAVTDNMIAESIARVLIRSNKQPETSTQTR